MTSEGHYCRVCGYYSEEAPWGEGGKTPNYEICSCCGVEFGNEDYTYESVLQYRKTWMEKGCVWFDVRKRSSDWNKEEQFKQIPTVFL